MNGVGNNFYTCYGLWVGIGQSCETTISNKIGKHCPVKLPNCLSVEGHVVAVASFAGKKYVLPLPLW